MFGERDLQDWFAKHYQFDQKFFLMHLLSVACLKSLYGSNERGKLFSICHTMKRCLQNTVKWRHQIPYFKEYEHLDSEYHELKKCRHFDEVWQHSNIAQKEVERLSKKHWYFEQFLMELYEQVIEHRPWTHLSWVITYTSFLQYGNVPRWCANDSNNRHNNDPFVVFWFCSVECKKNCNC